MDKVVATAIKEVRAISSTQIEEIFYLSNTAALILDRWVTKHLSLPRIYFPDMVCKAICEGLGNGTLSVDAWSELQDALRLRPLEEKLR